MFRTVLYGCVFAGSLGLITMSATAQQVVHAQIGTVSAIDDVSKTIVLFQDNGSEGQFKDKTSGKTHFAFDKKTSLDTTPSDSLKSKGAYVIVFYYGDNDDRTAVALKNLGAGPFTSTEGTVVKFDSKGHTISVKDGSGSVQTFKITDQTVAEGYMGAVDGYRFQAQKGDRVRVVATADTALFVRER
jgi:hypothetical protein